LLASRGFDTPGLSAQGRQRRSRFLNITRDIPQRRGEEHAKGIQPGSVEALIAAFQKSRFYPTKEKTRRHYDYALAVLAGVRLRDGRGLGQMPVAAIRTPHVEALHALLLEERAGAKRRAAAAIILGRRLWSFGRRVGMAPEANPFARPGLTAPRHSGIVWPREAFERFRAQAKAEGRASVALAALLCRDLCQRPGDILALTWSDWDPEAGAFRLTQSKTGVEVAAKASSAILAEMRKIQVGAPEEHIIRSEESGKPYKGRHFAALVAKIREKAGLPGHLIAKDWRHTGLTEFAEAGANIAGLQAMSGHKTQQILARYVKTSNAAADAAVEAREAARARQKQRALPPPPKALAAPEPKAS
jgi:integrase